MKKALFVVFVFGLFIFSTPFSSIASESAQAREHRALCEEWCAQHKNLCDFCTQDRTCGPSYSQQASFGWPEDVRFFACKGGPDDKANQAACQKWCNENRGDPNNCSRCTPVTGCGIGYRVLSTFKGKGGKDWHACTKTAYREASEENEAECKKYCETRKGDGCDHCSELYDCGHGYERMMYFPGKGKNWSACKKRASYKEESDANKDECVKWCKEHAADGCTKCSTLRYCGPGLEAMKHFEGRGKNWHACKKKK